MLCHCHAELKPGNILGLIEVFNRNSINNIPAKTDWNTTILLNSRINLSSCRNQRDTAVPPVDQVLRPQHYGKIPDFCFAA